MEFQELVNNSPLSVVAQIEEQIKCALLLGQLRSGDTLPSIRDVEKTLGISRNLVRRAYLNLAKTGILRLQQGKGVRVSTQTHYAQLEVLIRKAEQLTRETLERVEEFGIMPSSFARYLTQRAHQRELERHPLIYVDAGRELSAIRAANISQHLQVEVRGVSLEDLATMSPAELQNVKRVFTTYIRYDTVREILKHSKASIIPVGLRFTPQMISDFFRLPKTSAVIFVFDDRDFALRQLIVKPYEELLSGSTLQFTAKPLSKIKDIRALSSSGKYAKVVVSNRIWEELPPEIRSMPGITHPQMEIDFPSIEAARIEAGVIV